MYISSKQRKYTEVHAKDGRTLYLISPGFYLNKHLFDVYMDIGNGIEYSNLLSWMCTRYSGDEEIIEQRLNDALTLLAKRDLISVEDGELTKTEAVPSDENGLFQEHGLNIISQVDYVLTKHCNYSCKHCYLDFTHIPTEDFKLNEWIKVSDCLHKGGLQSVVITGGEPLTIPDLPKLIAHLSNLNVSIVLLTNGYLVDEKFVLSISPYRNNLSIQISLDGSRPESHDYQRNRAGAFDTTIKNIKLLTDNGFRVALAMLLSSHNVSDVLDGTIFRLARELNVVLLAITPSIIMSGNAIENNFEGLTAEQIIGVVKFVHNYEFDASYPTITISGPPALTPELSISNTDLNRPRCRRGINSFAVRPDGTVSTCSDFMEVDYNEYIYGNIFSDDLQRILDRAAEIRELILSRYMEVRGVCSICSALPHCGGACRADAYSTYASIYAPYPLCQNLYDRGLFPNSMIVKEREYKPI